MALRLNSRWCCLYAFCLTTFFGIAQPDIRLGDKDYKDKKQFERFHKRRTAVAAWQINQLREGALVVRLKTNHLLINTLLKQGDTILAKEKELETAAINLNTIRAYFYNYSFSKLYFIYSSSSDSLMNGIRKNIFLDSNLVVNPSIVMTEKFYLLAERDYVYNSTIGFVREDSARYVKEAGYGIREMALVVKNKYGHQLKKPFPYYSPDRADIKLQSNYIVMVKIHGTTVPVNIGGTGRLKKNKHSQLENLNSNNTESFNYEGHRLTLFIPKYLIYERISLAISNFNEELKMFYRKNMNIGVEKQNPDIAPFLY